MLPLDLEVPAATPIVDDERIWDLEEDMAEARGRAQVAAARKLLRANPASIDAYLVLSEHAQTRAEAVALAREAVRIGNQRWSGLANADAPIEWWWEIETRPFMRAILTYGNLLAAAGYRDEASEAFQTLLNLQPSDSVGARISLEELNLTLPKPQ